MKRENILKLFIKKVSAELDTLSQIAEQTRKSATDKDLKQEGKYDTRAIEEGYLAGAQAKRVSQLEADLSLLEAIASDIQTKHVQEGSIVKVVEEEDEKTYKYLIFKGSGGIKVSKDQTEVSSLSLRSKIAEELLGLEVGESAIAETPKGEKEYIILSID